MGPDEREWIARHGGKAEDFEWLARASIEPIMTSGRRGTVTQMWHPKRKKVDPNFCFHEIGRGAHWGVKRRGAIRPGKGLIVEREATCRICGKVLRATDDLDNGFMLPDRYIGTLENKPDGDSEDYRPGWRGPLPRFCASWWLPVDEEGRKVWLEITQAERRELLGKMPAVVTCWNTFLSESGAARWVRSAKVQQRDDARYAVFNTRCDTITIVRDGLGLASVGVEAFRQWQYITRTKKRPPKFVTILSNVSLYRLRVALGLWTLQPHPFDDSRATYEDMQPPSKPGFHQCRDREICKCTKARAWRASRRMEFIVSVDDRDIQIRQLIAAGDIVRALRVTGHKIKEISEMTGIPVRTVERMLEGLILRERVCDTTDTKFR